MNFFNTLLNKFFPDAKGIVLLIILPACFVVFIYFVSNITETLDDEDNDKVVEYEKQFAPLKEDLPERAIVNYVSDQNYQIGDFFIAAYVLVPVRIIKGLKPHQNYLIVNYLNKENLPKFKGYTLKRKYESGIMLFERFN